LGAKIKLVPNVAIGTAIDVKRQKKVRNNKVRKRTDELESPQ